MIAWGQIKSIWWQNSAQTSSKCESARYHVKSRRVTTEFLAANVWFTLQQIEKVSTLANLSDKLTIFCPNAMASQCAFLPDWLAKNGAQTLPYNGTRQNATRETSVCRALALSSLTPLCWPLCQVLLQIDQFNWQRRIGTFSASFRWSQTILARRIVRSRSVCVLLMHPNSA